MLPGVVQRVSEGGRQIYFETSREGVPDREGEDLAADALWASRGLFLEQGNLDIWHLSWLQEDPSFVIGRPVEVRREGPSLFVRGELFESAPGSSPPALHTPRWWADLVWHSMTQQIPPQLWFPSVLGKAQGAVVQTRAGRAVTLYKGPIEWYSVGLAPRVQHPSLPPVRTTPLGPFLDRAVVAKAERPLLLQAGGRRIAAMSYRTFAKAVQTAAQLQEGEVNAAKQALGRLAAARREDLEGSLQRRYRRRKRRVLGKLLRGETPGEEGAVAEAFYKCGGLSQAEARWCARRLGQELDALCHF